MTLLKICMVVGSVLSTRVVFCADQVGQLRLVVGGILHWFPNMGLKLTANSLLLLSGHVNQAPILLFFPSPLRTPGPTRSKPHSGGPKKKAWERICRICRAECDSFSCASGSLIHKAWGLGV